MSFLSMMAEYWIIFKIWLRDASDLHDDALHIHFSLLGLFLAALILRKRPDSIWCWLVVFSIEMVNEYIDLVMNIKGTITFQSGLIDIFNTMLWPTIILAAGRILFPPRPNKDAVLAEPLEIDNDSGDLPDQSFK